MSYAVRELRRTVARRSISPRARAFLAGTADLVRRGGWRELGDLWTVLRCEGLTAPDECQLLYRLGRAVRHGVIVEVGSFRGRSTVALALGSLRGRGAPVYAIEPHQEFVGTLGGRFGAADRAAFLRNVGRSGAVGLVRLINLSSEVVTLDWTQPVGLLWLDGDHAYPAVRRDFECWSPFLSASALVALHDSTREDLGPYRLVRELVAAGEFIPRGELGLVTVLERRNEHPGD